ncbi:O-antigen ligase family protein [Natrononativus amylolyticus]|uniref:O-antigen ligase family protein n=1 Tax=Natrononativus amylolyticus TaxID=2963434 RepID=UPI0020CC7D3E|nr:O-antigen ligase family protein [Natrononativus amylolyticus]
MAVIVASLTVTTWAFPRERGYAIALVAISATAVYAIVSPRIRIRTDPVFVFLFGGYWIGLLAHYYYHPHTELLYYILVTPLVVGTTVIVFPQLIDDNREAFAMGLTAVAVVIVAIGLVMLLHEQTTDENLYRWVGEPVMGVGNVRTVSIFHNPNTYGFFMMVGTLAALYTYLTRRGVIWLVALAVCLLGLLLAEGDAAFVGFTVAVVVLLAGFDRRLALAGFVFVLLGVYVAISLGHVGEVMETTLMSRVDRWVASLERLAQSPLFGIGFVDPGPEIGESNGPHNSYLHVLLNTGLIAGGLYLGAIAYALARGIRARWTPWSGFVFATGIGILLYMAFESHFLGGLSVSSVMLGITIGLLLSLEERPREHRDNRLTKE